MNGNIDFISNIKYDNIVLCHFINVKILWFYFVTVCCILRELYLFTTETRRIKSDSNIRNFKKKFFYIVSTTANVCLRMHIVFNAKCQYLESTMNKQENNFVKNWSVTPKLDPRLDYLVGYMHMSSGLGVGQAASQQSPTTWV